jgi:hypothetical protein
MCQAGRPIPHEKADRGLRANHGTKLASPSRMRIRLSTWHTSLWAAVGLAACGGNTVTSPSSENRDAGAYGGTGGTHGGSGGFGACFGSCDGGTGPGGVGGSMIVVGGASGVGGGGTGPGGVGGDAGTAGRPPVDPRCANPRPYLGPNGTPTGFVACGGGWLHRPERGECASIVPRPGTVAPATDSGSGCTRDDQCSSMTHGFCKSVTSTYPGTTYGMCVSGCTKDEDCSAGTICLCGDPVGTCVEANCTTDAACGDVSLCIYSERGSPCGGSYNGAFACQKPTDTCNSRLDCGPAENCETYATGRRCQSWGACGRPFLVDGAPRRAPLVGQSGGYAERPDRVVALAPSISARLAEHWSECGLMEHASIAAFARFTLELLSLGAPARLVEEAQDALGDEIAHTKLCFALASRYAGRALGPGPLPVHGALRHSSFLGTVQTAITEACIGETLAAVEAAEAAEHATDPHVKDALATIARDEARHAELGWKFLRWAFDSADAAMRARITEHLELQVERELARIACAGESAERADAAILLAYGILPSSLRDEVRAAALRELIAPIAEALPRAREQLVA